MVQAVRVGACKTTELVTQLCRTTRTNTIAVPSALGRGESCIRPDDCRRPHSGDHEDRPYADRHPIPIHPGAYFVTVCTRDRTCLFGHVVNGEMHLNEAGDIARRCCEDIPAHFPLVELDAFVIMPNHIHGIIVNTESCTGERCFAPTSTSERHLERCATPAMDTLVDIMPILGIIVPIMGVGAADRKPSSVLFNKTRRGVLALLYGHPDQTFYVNQIVQSLGSGSGAVQRELRLMAEAGILVRTQTGNMVYYQANSQCPIFDELKAIVRKTFGVADVIRQSLEVLAGRIRVAFVFGSVARSADTRASDIDLIIVGEITFDEAASSLSPAQEALGREINPVVYSAAEFKKRSSQDRSFVKEVSEGEKVFIMGDEDELGRLAGR